MNDHMIGILGIVALIVFCCICRVLGKADVEPVTSIAPKDHYMFVGGGIGAMTSASDQVSGFSHHDENQTTVI